MAEPMEEVSHEGGEAAPISAESPTSSSSDSESEEEARENLRLQALEMELANNPTNYDANVQYIKLLRKASNIEKLREAREAMSALFPLSPVMWQEWAKDETSLSSGDDAFPVIEKIYERGVSDYLSVSLWCDYLNYVQEHDPLVRGCSPAGITKARNLFERALTAGGLHVSEGSKIWEAYRDFEQAIFHTIGDTEIEAKKKQVERIRSIFHRQLSVPHNDLEATLLAYKSWEVEQGNVLDVNSANLDGISSHVASAYQKALGMYNARVQLEEQVSKQDLPDSERLKLFMGYLDFEKTDGDPSRIQILYERAITEFPISTDLWLDYTRYLDKTLKVANVVREAYSRAGRNCPWIGELWCGYLLSLERGHASENEISTVFEKALQCSFSSFEEYLDLYLTRVDGIRRRLSLGKEVEGLNLEVIRNTFQNASDYLSPHLKNTDGLLRLYNYWARLDMNLGNDLAAARGVWERLLKISGSMLEAWQRYITMEIETGHTSEARSIYKRCYSKRFPGTGSEDICHSWLRFEREYGMMEDFDHALQKVTPRLEELRLFRIQEESKGAAAPTDQRENDTKKKAHGKRNTDSNFTEQPPAKRQKAAAQKPNKIHGKDKPQAQSSGEPNKMEDVNAKPESMSEVQVENTVRAKTKVYTDQCTAFVSNLSLQANSDHLRDFFGDNGGVVAIRILKDKFTGKSRGLAYVDFLDEAHLAAALAKNKKMLLGKNVSIARSNPKQKKKDKEAALGTDRNSIVEGSEANEINKESGTSQAPLDGRKYEIVNVRLKGKNTFAVPRNVKPLGWAQNKPKKDTAEPSDETPKSNDEFRKMFLKTQNS